ncbi:hypothetical protein SAMN05216587_11459 [Selenomonas ruminantium]|uniref:Uncharacterized protein n=1 Tax=Selenomonas ruminantium TaxID=971 RepID=A0A1I0YJF4_SELRU|nr:hypothetical protein SAMN05216587_11459 [Selenomonas ruminantium]
MLRDRGTEGSAALRDDYGSQRERSRITRAAVLPALSALCQSEGLEDACSSFMRNPTHGGVPLLWWTGKLSTSQKNTAPPLIKGHEWQSRRGRRTVCFHSCGLPVVSFTRPTGAQVFALFPPGCEPSSFQHLVIPPDRPPPVQPVTGNACPLLLVDSCAVHVSTDTGGRILTSQKVRFNLIKTVKSKIPPLAFDRSTP